MMKVMNESCMETMQRFPDDFFDAVVTSPPYNMNLRVRNGEYCSRQITEEFSTKYQGFTDNMPIDDFYDFHRSALLEMLRISHTVFYNIQIVTGSKRAFFKLMGEFNENLKEMIVWDKMNAQPAMAEKTLNRQSELLLVFSSESDAIKRQFENATFARGTLNDVWQIRRGKKVNKNHSATFPEELVEKILTNFTNEKDLIYDPFSGSGTTGAVCKRMGRLFLGSETVKYYCDFANERILQTERL